MTTLSTNPPRGAPPAYEREPAIERKLARTWRKERAVTHGRGLSIVVVAIAALVLAFLAVDWVLLLPGSARLVLVLAGVAGVLYLVYRHWWRRIRPYDRLRTALRVEKRHPDLASVLVSYVQLESADAAHSPRLVSAMRREAIDRAAPIEFADIVDVAPLKKVATWAAVGVVILAALTVAAPQVMSTLLVRMVNPFATATYPTRTRIVAVTGDATVAEGAALRLTAETGGVTPPEGTIFLRTAGGDWEEGRLTVGDAAANTFVYELPSALESFEYYVRLGDAASGTHRVTVVPAPAPRQVAVTIAPPAYAEAEERVLDSLNFQALRGSAVTWRMTFEAPLRSAQWVPAEGEARDLTLEEGGRVATLQLTADETAAYRLRWTEAQHGFAFDDGVQYRMQVVPDQPPTVTLTNPREDSPGTLRKTLDIAFTASDDYGLRDAWIVYQVNDGEEQRKPLEALGGGSGDRRLAWRPADDVPALREGDILSWAIAVADNSRDAEGQPNVGRSTTRRLFVLSEPEYLAWIADRKGEMFDTLQELRGSQVEAADEIETLRRMAPPPASPQGETQP